MKCSVNECLRDARCKGVCHKHYCRWKEYGDPNHPYKDRDDKKRFWSKVKKTDLCWVWGGTISNKYGVFFTKGKVMKAHRFSLLLVGRIVPVGLEVDHLCRNTRCVNPDHLDIVSRKENNIRGYSPSSLNKKKIKCKYGHDFTKDNTYTYKGRFGLARGCKICRKERYKNGRIQHANI